MGESRTSYRGGVLSRWWVFVLSNARILEAIIAEDSLVIWLNGCLCLSHNTAQGPHYATYCCTALLHRPRLMTTRQMMIRHSISFRIVPHGYVQRTRVVTNERKRPRCMPAVLILSFHPQPQRSDHLSSKKHTAIWATRGIATPPRPQNSSNSHSFLGLLTRPMATTTTHHNHHQHRR